MKKVNEAAILRQLDQIAALLDRRDGSSQVILSIEPDEYPPDSDDMLVLRRRFVDCRSDDTNSEVIDNKGVTSEAS